MPGERKPPPIPPRTVKARTRKAKNLPVVAIGPDYFLAESGETDSTETLIDILPSMPPTLFCAVGAADFVAGVLSPVYILKYPGTWSWRAASHDRVVCAPNEFMKVTRSSVAINFFGWKNGSHHKIIDPITMYGHRIETIWPGDDDRIIKLLKWGVQLRDYCAENGWEVRPTLGSIASQPLTDPRFYPRARRKVPAKINERARDALPGNHYFLNVIPDPSNNFTAHYLDQHRAHHYHARTIPLPDADHCFAYGRFTDLAGTAFSDTDPNFSGLYCLDLTAPDPRPPFDWIGKKLDGVFVYSNELQHLLDVGYRVDSVRAAWGSIKRDTGLPRYAQWAEEQLDRHSDAPWLKPLLLATYGVLATRPLTRESVFRLAKNGTPVTVRTGKYKLNGLRVEAPRKLEPGVAHVIQRGMIEAATRSESIGLAQWLDYLGHTILSIYADAVIVEADDDKPLPEYIPDPWRLKRTLNHLQFINQQAFSSDAMTKLPGVSRETIGYHTHQVRGHAPTVTMYEVGTGRKIRTNRRI